MVGVRATTSEGDSRHYDAPWHSKLGKKCTAQGIMMFNLIRLHRAEPAVPLDHRPKNLTSRQLERMQQNPRRQDRQPAA